MTITKGAKEELKKLFAKKNGENFLRVFVQGFG